MKKPLDSQRPTWYNGSMNKNKNMYTLSLSFDELTSLQAALRDVMTYDNKCPYEGMDEDHTTYDIICQRLADLRARA